MKTHGNAQKRTPCVFLLRSCVFWVGVKVDTGFALF